MGLIHFENWDGVTAPSIPAGWNAGVGVATSSGVYTPLSSPNVLIFPATFGSGTVTATWGTADSVSGNVIVQGNVTFPVAVSTISQKASVFARGSVSTLVYTSSTFYEAELLPFFGTLELNAVVAGSGSQIGSVSLSGGVTQTDYYQITLTCNGTTISVKLQRSSDGFWLNSSGNFQSGVATAISVTDSSVTGAGYAGYAVAADAQVGVVDDWTFSSIGGLPATDGSTSYSDRAYRPGGLPVHQGWVTPPVVGDAFPPPGEINFQDRISWPGRTATPGRTANTAYDAIARGPQIGDLNQPAAPRWPDTARGLGRAAFLDIFIRPTEPDVSEPAMPSWPTMAPGSRRASVDSYGGTFNQLQVPSSTLMGAPITFPNSAPGPRRLSDYTIVAQANLTDANMPADPIYLDRIIWPDNLRRAPNIAYLGTSVQGAGAGQITPPPLSVTPYVYFPDQARGPSRSTADTYGGLLSEPPLPDVPPPAGKPVFPDRAIARPSSITTVVQPSQGDAFAEGQLASFPQRAAGPQRAVAQAYSVAIVPQIADRLMPAARPVWPVTTPARATATTAHLYEISQISTLQLPVPVQRATYFPDTARGAARAIPPAYQGLLSAPNPTGASLARRPYFPDSAPGAARAPAASYTILVSPATADVPPPAGKPVFPAMAPAASRISSTAYAGLLSNPVPADAVQPSGSPSVVSPQRGYEWVGPGAYAGLSGPALADASQPAGVAIYPDTAKGRFPSAEALSALSHEPHANVFALSVSAGINLSAFCGPGSIINLAVSATVNFSVSMSETNTRYRYGDTVNLAFTVPPGALLSLNPILVFSSPSGAPFASGPLYSWDGGLTFQADVLLTQLFPPGRITGSTVLVTTAGSFMVSQSFDLVATGDVGSTIVAIYNHESVAGRYTIAQLRNGQLVQGSSPWMT